MTIKREPYDPTPDEVMAELWLLTEGPVCFPLERQLPVLLRRLDAALTAQRVELERLRDRMETYGRLFCASGSVQRQFRRFVNRLSEILADDKFNRKNRNERSGCTTL